MLQHEILERCGIGLADSIVLVDPDGLWDKSGIESIVLEKGYACTFASDAVALRYHYEKNNVSGLRRWIVRYAGGYIPYDIGKSVKIVDISLGKMFPRLHTGTLRSCTNIDLELVLVAYADVYTRLGSDDTEDFCTGTIWQPKYLEQVCCAYREKCNQLLSGHPKAADWYTVADHLGFMLTAQRLKARLSWLDGWYREVYATFAEWMETDYKKLYTMPVKKQPWLLCQALNYIRRNQNGKVAVILMDGMSYADYHLIRKDLVRSDYSLKSIGGMFSFVPSITSVARQALFSGKRPAEHIKPFSLDNEEKQWRDFWKEQGIKDNDIVFAKS